MFTTSRIERASRALAVVLVGFLSAGAGPGAGSAPSSRPRFDALVAQARREVRAVAPESLRARLGAPGLILIDLREESELAAGRLPGARSVPRGVLEGRIEALAPALDADIVLYCHSGARSALAAQSLKRMGYSRVSHLEGGFSAWTGSGMPLEPAPEREAAP